MTITKTALGGLSDWAEESIINFGYHTGYGTVLLDGTYIAGGWTLAPSDINSKLSSIVSYVINPVQGYDFVWDHANSKLIASKRGWGADTAQTLTVIDDPSAASNGTAVKVAVGGLSGGVGYLNSANAGTADAYFQVESGGSAVQIDYAASPAGVSVYVDEDAAYGKRLQCVSPTGQDILIPMSDGQYLVIAHDSQAASNGVQLYFDDNGANPHERLLFVSPSVPANSHAVVVLPTMPIAGLNGVTLKIKAEGY